MIRLFRISIPASVLVLILSDTLLITLCYVVGALLGIDSTIGASFYLLYDNGWLQIAFVVVVTQLAFYFLDLYGELKPWGLFFFLQQLCLVVGLNFLLQALIGYAQYTTLQLPQWTMMYGSILAIVVLPAWRVLFSSVLRKALPVERLLFFQTSPLLQELSQHLAERPDLGFEAIGFVGEPDATLSHLPHLGPASSLLEMVRQHRPRRVIVAHHRNQAPIPVHDLLELRMTGTVIEEEAALYETVFARISLKHLDSSDIMFSPDFQPRILQTRLQTVYSILLSIIGVILTAPIMLVTALLVKVTSPGPALYKQKRVGIRGSLFYVYKFRSMYIDAEARSGPVWASKNDPRVTPLGRWLRLLRLDELPQFFNVIRGNMALVGPRPERPEFCTILEEKLPFYAQRHFVKPGVTGWAQINYKYADTIEDTSTKLEYDLYYVKHMSPALDAYIIFHTLKVMLLFRGSR